MTLVGRGGSTIPVPILLAGMRNASQAEPEGEDGLGPASKLKGSVRYRAVRTKVARLPCSMLGKVTLRQVPARNCGAFFCLIRPRAMDGTVLYAIGCAAAVGYLGFAAVALALLLRAASRMAD
jgi:hypothetical protein